MTINDINIVQLPQFTDPRGNLSVIQNGDKSYLPFDIKRAYWIYDVPGGRERHGHAFRTASELIVALSGSFDVVLSDGINERRIHLCRSYYGVNIPPMTWRCLDNFSTNSVALVVSSTLYNENDYIRDFNEYQSLMTDGDKQ
ncbi:MAG: FdtA/QdtA family cupin domain-containing protein [Muribaculaceae bacterium]|nr:FdtA/QdtA family cupin domain-containing protein [Muribaculaceae bacterium]